MRRKLAYGFSGLLVLALFAAGYQYMQRSPLPSNVTKQASFTVLIPAKDWTLLQPSYRNGVVHFTAQKADLRLTYNQQSPPSTFSEIPQYYPTLLIKLNEYKSFGVKAGTVHLVHPTELAGKQSAVLLTDQTLLFIQPNKELTEQQWRDAVAGLHPN